MKHLLQAKSQIMTTVTVVNCCLYSFLSGLFLSSATKLEPKMLEMPYVDRSTFDFVRTKMSALYNDRLSIEKVDFAGKEFLLISGSAMTELYDDLGINVARLLPYTRCCENDCCKSAFLKGAFIGVGRFNLAEELSEISIGYSFELALPTLDLADSIVSISNAVGIHLKYTRRIGRHILYLRNSDDITHALHTLGAVKSALDFQNELALRSVKNDVYRQNNCFDANQNKTIEASLSQMEAIRYLLSTVGLDSLPHTIAAAARLRLAYPDDSLSELCQKYGLPITRGGMKYKLDGIIRYSQKIKGTK